jgi:hypothetical protein
LSSESASDAWYLAAEEYWVPAGEADQYPVRQGDVFGPLRIAGEEWAAAQIVHPTCELGKRSVKEIQILRVRPLLGIADPKQQARVAAGFEEKQLQIRPAFAHTFFLAPAGHPEVLAEPGYSNLREVALFDRSHFTPDARVAAMTHDARVSFIRRKLYFRYRIALPFSEVRRLEANRIRNDPSFEGPKPDWAT